MKTLSAFLIVGFVILSLLFWSFYRNFNQYFNEDEVVERISGMWKFNLGDKPEYADPNFDDKDWAKIRVPGRWENQGYKNYDGYAWYRTKFKLSSKYLKSNLYVSLGYIDDVDEVYLNGARIGQTGNFPPYYESAHNKKRMYKLPNEYLKEKNNVLAVRVFDQYESGGIVSGNIEIIQSDYYEPEMPLPSMWKFNTGDDMMWSRKDFDDSEWKSIKVPGFWESQGYPDYDGFAWYRTTVILNSEAAKKQFVLMLGKIDDINEVYLNGRFLGGHGNFDTITPDNANHQTNFYNTFRAYFIPKGYLLEGENVIAVRVYDFRLDGGIYGGPIGLATQDMYTSQWNSKKNNWK